MRPWLENPDVAVLCVPTKFSLNPCASTETFSLQKYVFPSLNLPSSLRSCFGPTPLVLQLHWFKEHTHFLQKDRIFRKRKRKRNKKGETMDESFLELHELLSISHSLEDYTTTPNFCLENCLILRKRFLIQSICIRMIFAFQYLPFLVPTGI